MSSEDTQLAHAFEAELLALRGAGRALAERQPMLAGALAQEARDPDIERLLAGFAYLSATTKIHHERLAPRFVLDMLGLLAPELAEPEPARVLAQLTSAQLYGHPYLVIPAGHELALPRAEGTVYWSTERKSVLWPFGPVRHTWAVPREGRVEWTIRLEGSCAGLVAPEGPDSLEFYLARPWPEAATVLLALCAHLQSVTCRLGSFAFALEPGAVAPTRLATFEPPKVERDNALPPGLRHARRFYALPQRAAFFGLDLRALRARVREIARHRTLEDTTKFELKLVLDDAAELPPTLAAEALKLSVCPLVNSVVRDAMPVRLEALAAPRPLRAEGLAPDCSHVLGIVDLQLSHPRRAARDSLAPAHLADEGSLGYQLTRLPHPRDSWHDVHVSVVGPRPLTPGDVLSGQVRVGQRRSADCLPEGAVASTTFEMAPIEATLLGAVQAAQDILIAQQPAAHTQLWRLIGLVPGRLQQRFDVAALRELLQAASSFATADAIGRSTLGRHSRSFLNLEENITRRLIRGALVPQRSLGLQLDPRNLTSLGEAFCLASLVDNLLADGQGAGEVQQISFAAGQRRYVLAPRSGPLPLDSSRAQLT